MTKANKILISSDGYFLPDEQTGVLALKSKRQMQLIMRGHLAYFLGSSSESLTTPIVQLEIVPGHNILFQNLVIGVSKSNIEITILRDSLCFSLHLHDFWGLYGIYDLVVVVPGTEDTSDSKAFTTTPSK